MKKKVSLLTLLTALALTACSSEAKVEETTEKQFVTIDGCDLITPDGNKLFIKGTNLGNWLNPEGYMFGFRKTNSARMIDQMFRELVGPEQTDIFWQNFKDNYITRKDIEYIASTGANTIRLPFHYKLFTNEDYMGLNSKDEGFVRIDSVVTWCRDTGLYLILDMHDAPGGQTGDNIDDSYGYPWLFDSEKCQQQFCDIWRDIAARYCDEPVILGYELINEPIAPYFDNVDELNSKLEGVHKMAVKAIREVDNNHIILLGGAQWNGNFKPFTDWTYDDKLMYTCHRYGGAPTTEAIQEIVDFKNRTGLPMYMGEIGHNTDEWQAEFCKTMVDNNIGYTFWPYKKIDGSCMMGIKAPEAWDSIIGFSEAPRVTYADIRAARPDQATSVKILADFIDSCKVENCVPQQGYISSIGLKPQSVK